MGNPDFQDFPSLLECNPFEPYDNLIHNYLATSGTDPSRLPNTPWTSRARFEFVAESFNTKTIPRPKKASRKYKPVHQKRRPVPTYMPDPIAQQFKSIPILEPLLLPFHPPPIHTLPFDDRITSERLDYLLAKSDTTSLSTDELALLAFVTIHRSTAFAWDYSQKGTFSPEFFPDYEIPIIEHQPWQDPPIPIPKAIEIDVRKEIRKLMDLGKFEYSSASYRSPLWAVAKKPGSDPPVRIVIAVTTLNSYTVRDASLPPNINEFAESFVGYSCYGLMDMFSGFDGRIVHPKSRPLGTAHSPEGPIQQTTLIQGYTNSIQEFGRCMDHSIKHAKINDIADNFIDDCGVKGPRTRYDNQPIEQNQNIRRFIWEYCSNLDRFLACLASSGMTASIKKTILFCQELSIVGSKVCLDGWILGPELVEKVQRWPIPISYSEVRQFLGLAGGARRWIKNYSFVIHPINSLLSHLDEPFSFAQDAVDAMEMIKEKLTTAPVLIRIDYEQAVTVKPQPRDNDEGLIIVGVDSSWKGAGWVLYQIRDGKKKPALFGSSTFNKTQQNYGQAKTEVFGVFVAMRALRHRVWGTHFRLEHDATSLPKMMKRPDEVPNAPMLRWVSWLLLFDMEYQHLAGTAMKMEDALSRAPNIDIGRADHSEGVDEFLESYGLAQAQRFTDQDDDITPYQFLLRSLQIRHANPFHSPDHYPVSVPCMQISQSMVFATVPLDNFQAARTMVNSLITNNHISNGSSSSPIPSTDRYYRKVPILISETCSLGDEMVRCEFVQYAYMSVPDKDFSKSPGHKFGSRDQDDEEYWGELRQFFLNGRYPDRLTRNRDKLAFLRRSRRFILRDNKIWLVPKKNHSFLPRLVIEQLIKRGALMLEGHLLVAHKGRDKTYQVLRDRFYWPNMWDDISYFVRSCIECQKAIEDLPFLPFHESWQAPLLRHFDLDTIHMPKGVSDMNYVIQAIERTILWPEAKALKAADAKSVAKFIYEELICRFGCIPVITMDNGPEFQKDVRHLLRTLYKCEVVFSTPYNPQGNAPVERHHRILVSSLFKLAGDAKGIWPRFIFAVLFAMRVTISRATGYSPYYLLYGQQPVFSFDIREATWSSLDWDKVTNFEGLIELRARQIARRDKDMAIANQKLRDSRRRAIDDMHKRHGNKFDFADYEIGMYVWLRESRLDEIKGGKGEWTYAGPYIIHERRGKDTFILRELSGAVMKAHINIRRLRLFFFRPDNQTLRTSIGVPPAEDALKSNPSNTIAASYNFRARYGCD